MKKKLLLFLLAAAAAEIFIFNFLFFMPALNGCERIELKNDGVLLAADGPATIQFKQLNKKVCYVTFNLEGVLSAQITPVFTDSARRLETQNGTPFNFTGIGGKNGLKRNNPNQCKEG